MKYCILVQLNSITWSHVLVFFHYQGCFWQKMMVCFTLFYVIKDCWFHYSRCRKYTLRYFYLISWTRFLYPHYISCTWFFHDYHYRSKNHEQIRFYISMQNTSANDQFNFWSDIIFFSSSSYLIHSHCFATSG